MNKIYYKEVSTILVLNLRFMKFNIQVNLNWILKIIAFYYLMYKLKINKLKIEVVCMNFKLINYFV